MASEWGQVLISGAQWQNKGQQTQTGTHEHEKKLFTLKVSRLPKEVVKPLSLEIFKTCLDPFLCELL